MGKTKMERYYSWIKNNTSIEKTKKMIYFTDNQYVISNAYSLIFLNERPFGKYSDFTTLGQFIDKFHTDNTDSIDVEKTQGEGKEKLIPYKDGYSFKYSYYKNMKEIIKPDKVEVGFWGEIDPRPILFLENTKTTEKGFLLPVKGY